MRRWGVACWRFTVDGWQLAVGGSQLTACTYNHTRCMRLKAALCLGISFLTQRTALAQDHNRGGFTLVVNAGYAIGYQFL